VKQSIEENMLKMQSDKLKLATMSLGQTLSKKELQARRVKELKALLT
jgi:SNF2 family DNA or RNA helicase